MFDVSTLPAAFDDSPPADYRSIFDERGAAYHRAMVEFPGARQQEFEHIARLASVRAGQVVCDAPSGGGYLHSHLPLAEGQVIALETSETFYRLCKSRGQCRAVLTQLDRIELPDASVDCVISLAGLHHLPDRGAFFREAHRILRPGGTLCVADVAQDTRAARFLNVFVDRCSSMGHDGDFFSASAATELQAAGFHRVSHEYRRYHWTFRNVDEMVRFVALLFGLDRATPEQVLEGIGRYLGYDVVPGRCRMNWGLMFMRGSR